MNKLFISGRPRSGKSSEIIRNLTEFSLSHCGFAMQRLTKSGETWAFRLLDLSGEPYLTHLETDNYYDDIAIYMTSPGKWRGRPAVFDGKGCIALEKCRDQGALVIMDELGIFERDALDFQRSVFKILDSQLAVLGVLKDKSNPFLDRVRSHPAVVVAEYPAEETVRAIQSLLGQGRL